MSLTGDLIALIRNRPIREDDLDRAALFLLDTLASAYAGSATPVGKLLSRWLMESPGNRNRHVFVSGALAHVTETDDLHRASVTHPGCVVVPVILMLSGQQATSGRQLLTAMLHGYEAMCRIGNGVGPAHYRIWHNTATCGPFGSSMAASTMKNLDERRTRDALGNAGTQASGLWQFLEEGSMSKHLHAGRAAESGLLAAELAAHGFTGPARILEGDKGFFAGTCPDPVPGNVLAEPDAPWQLTDTSIKPWPSCRHTHPVIDCAFALCAELGDERIASIEIDTYQAALDICDNPEPETEYQAKFSLQHTVAVALMDGVVGLNSFGAVSRNRCQELRCIVRVRSADPFRSRYPDAWGASVVVTTEDGKVIRAERKDCRGDPELPLDSADLRSKAKDLLQYGGLCREKADRLCEDILSLPRKTRAPDHLEDFLQHLNRQSVP